jgi:flagellar hook protein FlgE
MSLSGALTSAVTGLDAQSRALGAISDNISNSQTVGYKRVDTEFQTLLTVSNAFVHEPGGVTSKPLYTNDVQGTVQKTNTETNLGISGAGYFAVSRVKGVNGSALPTFEPDPLYTRAGDFGLDQSGFLVNSAGYYLNGWDVNPATGIVSKNALVQIRLNQLKADPQATTAINYAANLPTTPGATLSASKVNFFDAQGTPHAMDVNWAPKVAAAGPPIVYSNDTYTVTLSTTDPAITGAATATFPITADVQFYLVDTGANKAGSLRAITNITGPAGAIATPAGTTATIPVLANFGGGALTASTQNFNFNLGTYGTAAQTTLFTGTDVDFVSAQQDGLPPGSFRNLDIDAHGLITLNFDNGARKTEFQIPLINFSNYNGLQPQNGNAYSTTVASGTPEVSSAGSNGTGNVVASSTEGSNVDIAAEFTKLIQTQRAYEANTKVVTTANDMLQITDNLIR